MKKAFAKTLFTCLAMFAIAGYANRSLEQEFDSDIQENVIVDSRPLSPQKKFQMEQSRQAEDEGVDYPSGDEAIELSSLVIPIKQKDFITLASNHDNGVSISSSLYHKIDFFPQINILKTKDGAEWIFDDPSIPYKWHPGENLVISPKGRWIWGSNYSYVITNVDRGTSIDVNLFLGPKDHGEFTTWIVGIDQNNVHVYLMNGRNERTVWEISRADYELFKEWEVNDTLIIGRNDSWYWWLSSFNHILVNVNMNHYVRARQISSNPYHHDIRGGYAS